MPDFFIASPAQRERPRGAAVAILFRKHRDARVRAQRSKLGRIAAAEIAAHSKRSTLTQMASSLNLRHFKLLAIRPLPRCGRGYSEESLLTDAA